MSRQVLVQKQVQYKWKQGAVLRKNVSAQEVGVELETIKESESKLTPKVILKYAKSKKSVLHNLFDWEDTVAAEKWREQQARSIVASIVEVVVVQGEKTEQRSYYSVSNKGKADEPYQYVSLTEALNNNDYRQQLLSKIINHLENTTMLMKMFKNTK